MRSVVMSEEFKSEDEVDIIYDSIYGTVLDVLWDQPIQLIQVASNSELRENQWNDLIFFEIVPSHCFGASEASKIDYFKNQV